MNFSLSSSTFNSLLKRLVSLTGSDKDAKIIFILEKAGLEVFYSSKIDKIDTVSFFHEKIKTESMASTGIAGISASSLLSIKVPEKSGEDKFPQCSEISFSFTKSVLAIKYGIKWSKDSKENVTKMNFALLDSSGYSMEEFKEVFNDKVTPIFQINPVVLTEAINLVNFIKADATTKEANGCLLYTSDNNFLLVNTDSNSAVKYEFNIEKSGQKDLNCILSNSVLNAIKLFIPDEGTVEFGKLRNHIFVTTDDRRMVVPTMSVDYIISEPVEFFKIEDELVAELELKPFISTALALVTKTNDPYKRLTIKVGEEEFSIASGADKSTDLPYTFSKDSKINVNGSLLISCLQRLLTLDLKSSLYYNEDSNRITVTSPDNKMICLIQGLSL